MSIKRSHSLRVHLEATAGRGQPYPREAIPEVAFLGRSNCGKSSLLNRLAGRNKLARTGASPGATRRLGFYRVEGRAGMLRFVDLPGYGYARVSRRERAGWRELVEHYLSQRSILRLALLLQDLRRDPSDEERQLLDWLAAQGREAVVVLTKIDKCAPSRRLARVRDLAPRFGLPPERVLAVSSRSGAGIDALWRTIATACRGPVGRSGQG